MDAVVDLCSPVLNIPLQSLHGGLNYPLVHLPHHQAFITARNRILQLQQRGVTSWLA